MDAIAISIRFASCIIHRTDRCGTHEEPAFTGCHNDCPVFVSLSGLYFGDNALILLWTILLGIAGDVRSVWL